MKLLVEIFLPDLKHSSDGGETFTSFAIPFLPVIGSG
jgi:hypothetical protein